MTALVLDTRALEVIADPKADLQAARRMRDMLAYAGRLGIPVRVPTAVLTESYRGPPQTRRSTGSWVVESGRSRSVKRQHGRQAGCVTEITWIPATPLTPWSSLPQSASAAALSQRAIR
jgi:hypothetical protein